MAGDHYRLDLTLKVEGDLTLGASLFHTLAGEINAKRAAGTYVEIEGDEVFNFTLTDEITLNLVDWPMDKPVPATVPQHFMRELTRADRPLVLLPVGGGNQVFDHWEGDCGGQGARCELAEPQPPHEGISTTAVFRKERPDLMVTAAWNPGMMTRASHFLGRTVIPRLTHLRRRSQH